MAHTATPVDDKPPPPVPKEEPAPNGDKPEEEPDWADDEVKLDALDSGIDPEDSTANVEITRADPTEPYKSASTFEEIGLSEELLKGVYAMKFQKPSKIQAASLPLILPKADGTRSNLIAQGHNGSGKTACFVLGMLSHVDSSKTQTQAVCIVPTRELARQIVGVIEAIGKFTSATVRLVVKETDEERRIAREQMRNRTEKPPPAHVVVGTPGKLMDLVKRRALDISAASVVVLDEADEMVNTQGMGDQTLRIKRHLPPTVQTLLFSATYSDGVRELAKRMAPNANHIWVKRETLSLDKVSQYYFRVGNAAERYSVLQEIYETLTLGQTIIFVRTRNAAQTLTENLRADGNAVSVLYGGSMSPEERDRVIDEFRHGTTKVLVTTNVLSRGVDVRAITAVINYDLPMDPTGVEADPETYLHRIGRTGRFGTKGVAINLVHDEKSMRILTDLEKYYDKKIVEVTEVEDLERHIKML